MAGALYLVRIPDSRPWRSFTFLTALSLLRLNRSLESHQLDHLILGCFLRPPDNPSHKVFRGTHAEERMFSAARRVSSWEDSVTVTVIVLIAFSIVASSIKANEERTRNLIKNRTNEGQWRTLLLVVRALLLLMKDFTVGSEGLESCSSKSISFRLWTLESLDDSTKPDREEQKQLDQLWNLISRAGDTEAGRSESRNWDTVQWWCSKL